MKRTDGKTRLIIGALVIAFLMAMTGFLVSNSEKSNSVFAADAPITGINIALSDGIVVKFTTTTTDDDGSYLVVKYGSDEVKLTSAVGGVFRLNGIAPQRMGDQITATLYDKDNVERDSVSSFSVKSYLESLWSDSDPELNALVVDMLNYGAAAQTYIGYDTENLVTADLTEEQKAYATGALTPDDYKAASGSRWVGANVRFDYKMSLLFAFKAETLDGLTVKIDGKEVTPVVCEGYEEQNYYVVRSEPINVVNINKPVTATIEEDGQDDQTFTYSLSSYVAAKTGSNDDALADLVNSMYKYGNAAVGYARRSLKTDVFGEVDLEPYKLEAEMYVTESEIDALRTDCDNKSASDANNPSGSGFVSGWNDTGSVAIRYTFDSSKATKAVLGVNVGKSDSAKRLSDMFTFTVNDSELSVNQANAYIPVYSGSYNGYDWADFNVVEISLREGKNTIVVNKKESATDVLNLDYVSLYTDAEISGLKKNYAFNVNDAETPSEINNEYNPFASVNGGSSTKSYTVEKGVWKYGNANGGQFVAYVNASEATSASFRIINDVRPNTRTFAYAKVASNPYISAFSLNDNGLSGVVACAQTYTCDTWNKVRQCEIATLSLRKGPNKISFTIGGDNINIAGIAFDADAEITLWGEHSTTTYDANASENHATEVNELNPFVSVNGGSTNKTYGTENSVCYRYGSGNGSNLTVTLFSHEDTTIILNLMGGTDRRFCADPTQNTSTTNANISSFTVNGENSGYTLSGRLYYNTGWNTMSAYEIGTVELKKGKNVLAFSIGGDNINYSGISIESITPVYILNTRSTFDLSQALEAGYTDETAILESEYNPFYEGNGGAISDNIKYGFDNTGKTLATDTAYDVTGYKYYRYGYKSGKNKNDVTFTVTLNAANKTYIRLYLINNNVRGAFCADGSGTPNSWIKTMTVNGENGGYTLSSTSFARTSGWHKYQDCEIAVVELQEGANVITFTITGPADTDHNSNIRGVVVDANSAITLGSAS